MRTFASFLANNAGAADRLRSFFSRSDRPGGFSDLVQGDHPGDPGARITAQVFAIGPDPGGRS